MAAKSLAGLVVVILFGLSSGLAAQPAAEAESTVGSTRLCRLRAGPATPLDSEGLTRIQVFADHAHFPAGEGGCDCLSLSAVTARFALPDGHELISVEIPASLGPPEHWYSAVKAAEGGWFLGLFPLHESTAALPEALSRELWSLTIQSAPSAEAPSIVLVAAPPGSDEGPRFYLSGGGRVVPTVSASAASEFPTPTEAELAAVIEEAQVASPAEIPAGPETLLGGTDPETPCDAIYAQGPVPTDAEFTFLVPSPGVASIQQGVSMAIAGLTTPPQDPNAVAVVTVLPGVYNESVVIDTQNWLGHLILVSSVGPGPDSDTVPANVDLATRIDPLGLGPCILVHGGLGSVPPSTGRVTIGWSIFEDLDLVSPFPGPDGRANARGWRGFDLVNGGASANPQPPFTLDDALGIAVREVESPVEIRGCWIHGHSYSSSPLGYEWAGLGIRSCEVVSVLQCDISDNTAWNAGAGLGSIGSSVLVGRSFVHDNGFHESQPFQMMGGGICARNSRLTLCSSFIYSNSARLGGGIAFALGNAPLLSLWAEENTIYGNSGAVTTSNPLSVPYRGGGLWIGPDPFSAPLPSPLQHSIGLFRNRFRNNDITIPSGSPAGTAPPAVNEAGGGLYIEANLADGAGPLDTYPSQYPRSLIIGNAFWNNNAEVIGGGAFIGLWSSPEPVAFESNTFFDNTLNDTTSGIAADLHLPFSGFPALMGYVTLTGGNQLIENQDSSFQARSWFAECDTTGLFLTPPVLPMSHLDNIHPGGCTPPGTSANLRPATAFCTDTDSKLLLRNFGEVDELPALGPGSPCIDQGSDWTVGGDSGLHGVFLFDLELDPRPNGDWDPGAEEWTLFDFIRGDTNGDASVNIADAILLLADLFPPPPRARPPGDADHLSGSSGHER